MTTPLTRADLQRVFGNEPKIILAFEQIQQSLATNVGKTAANVEATSTLQDATVITLSPNDTLTNERILAVDPDAFTLSDGGPGGEIVLGLLNLILLNGGYRCAFNLQADTSLDLPATGLLLSNAGLEDFADDAAAAAGGVLIDGYYRTGSTLKIRVA